MMILGWRARTLVLVTLAVALAIFLAWRFLRPMNIFVVSEAFERPITTRIPNGLKTLSAAECGDCHRDHFEEWRTSIHHAAWTDPYFQADFRFDGSQQICKNCHIPLDRQQEATVAGFRDSEKWHPILAPNPAFDPALQNEGVTCAACHVQDGVVLGPYGSNAAPHPVQKLDNPNQICLRCHVVGGNRWDTYYKMPPCGTVAEIRDSARSFPDGRDAKPARGGYGEITAAEASGLGCVECHMPAVQRAIVQNGTVREGHHHFWRGGHNPEMVRRALTVKLDEAPTATGKRRVVLTVENTGTTHFLPTGTPDRHLLLRLRLLDDRAKVLVQREEKLVRTILWRPFIADLWDTRLPPSRPHALELEIPATGTPTTRLLEASVSYFLLDERRRRRIGYEDVDAIGYEVFRRTVPLDAGMGEADAPSLRARQ